MADYKTVSCHKTKTAAKKKQKAMHEKGLTAKIVTTGKGKDKKHCVESKGKSKRPMTATKKKKATKRKSKKRR